MSGWKEHNMSGKPLLRDNWRYLVVSLALLVGLAVLAQNVWASVDKTSERGVAVSVSHITNAAPVDTDTPTPTPSAILVGHVTWVGVGGSIQSITLTLIMGSTEINYPSQNTDASGFFTVSVGSLAN